MTSASGPLLQVLGVSRRFGAVTAVDGIHLEIRQGEFFSLLGPSGCGKTTLLRMIAGFEPLDGGQILLDGQDIGPLPPHRRPVNTVFQHYALFPHMTVFENVAFGIRRQGRPPAEIKERVDEALALVRLESMEDRRPAQLSGGQRQRVALARALVLRPRLLLLDEPLGALDRQLRLRMQVELKALQRSSGISFLFVTHDQREALSMSDRIAVLHRGRIEQLGTGTEIYHQPRSEFVARFLGASNLLPGRVESRHNGVVQVRLEGGPSFELPAPPERNMEPASRVSVMVRPEWLSLVPAEGGANGAWPVTVESRQYQGAWISYAVSGLGPDPIEVHVRTSGDCEPHFLAPGEPAKLVWPPGTGVVLPPEAAS